MNSAPLSVAGGAVKWSGEQTGYVTGGSRFCALRTGSEPERQVVLSAERPHLKTVAVCCAIRVRSLSSAAPACI